MSTKTPSWPDRRAIWRWHFYAGLICAPVVLWLAATGSIYLFRQQIETALDAPYASLHVTEPRAPSARVQAAVQAVPGAKLSAYVLPATDQAATQVLVVRSGETFRVYVHPQTLAVLKSVREEDRFMRRVFRLHGELLAGNVGSAIVELAACWAIVLILTGLVLWWPTNGALAGVLWPRLAMGPRVFWRDMHAVTGFWVSACALFLLSTGLPWAKFWGDYLKEVRHITGTADGAQDWTNGANRARNAHAQAMRGDHHDDHHGAGAGAAFDAEELDRVESVARSLNLAPPVLVSPPAMDSVWKVKSDAANRPLRLDAKIDGRTGAVLSRRTFSQRHPIDQIVGYGAAAHEGQLFGWPNLLLGLVTAVGLVALCLSALIMWWQRRPAGVLGAPDMLARPRFSITLLAMVAALSLLFPLLGASIVCVALLERLVLRHLSPVRTWLGLSRPASP